MFTWNRSRVSSLFHSLVHPMESWQRPSNNKWSGEWNQLGSSTHAVTMSLAWWWIQTGLRLEHFSRGTVDSIISAEGLPRISPEPTRMPCRPINRLRVSERVRMEFSSWSIKASPYLHTSCSGRCRLHTLLGRTFGKFLMESNRLRSAFSSFRQCPTGVREGNEE